MCEECFPKPTKTDGEGRHKDSTGKLLSCCDPKIKRASQRYPLHAEHMLKHHGVSAEEYDRQAKLEAPV
jgi:hypothetical protein